MEAKNYLTISYALAGLVAFLIFREFSALILDLFSVTVMEDNVVSLPLILAAAFGLGLFFFLRSNQKVNTFCAEVVVELMKVTWPARKETVMAGVVVTIMVAIASLILFLFDSIWGSLTGSLLKG